MTTMLQRTPWQIQKAVLHALLARELKTRFGQYRLGIVWALLEPLMSISVFMGLYYFRGIAVIGGLVLPVFLATGIAMFFYFRKVISQCMGAVTANRNLFIYRQVRVFDAFVCRFLMEMVITFVVVVVIITGAWWLGYHVTVVNSLKFLWVFALLSLFSFGCGLVFAVFNTLYREMGKFIPMLLRPLFFISGTFFSINDIPPSVQPLLLWNPLLHAFELFRSCFSPHYNTSLVSMDYLMACTLVAITLGMLAYRANWRKMLTV
ncbi:ABC transporter permease [Candidatus Sororendozoicomonas aggregata]|uniref:ABC transporter permease n=1 Tax=Candidatus Sororendozoicomonas aggregata TaxID=3073239 RepID=UPI002ED2DD6E